LRKPARAEQLLRSAIEIGDDDLAAYQLLWTLLNVTGRAELAESVFWRVYELSPENERPLRLREWYMNQFFPYSATEPLDRMMNVLASGEMATPTTESRRFLRFRESEPEAPLNHAALAQWCQQEGDPSFALRLLDAAAAELDNATHDPFFLATYLATLLDLGEHERAAAYFKKWPDSDRGHLYWKSHAAILDEVEEKPELASQAYERALEIWPGPIDWRLRHRRAACLARIGEAGLAAEERERATAVQKLMNIDTHERFRNALGSIQELEKLEIVDFYRKLGRNREADCWLEQIQRMRTGESPKAVPDDTRSP
jgi:tetratricopeptide (TPR) repeat protein